MLANVLFNGLLHESVQPVMNSAFPTYSPLDLLSKSDMIAAVVIGVIVLSGAVFALMCRYK
jgi:hypothetical protein